MLVLVDVRARGVGVGVLLDVIVFTAGLPRRTITLFKPTRDYLVGVAGADERFVCLKRGDDVRNRLSLRVLVRSLDHVLRETK